VNRYSYNKWDNYVLPQLTENDYGFYWPDGTSQLTKELKAFRICREGRGHEVPELLSMFDHFLNIIRLLFPENVDIYKEVKKSDIYYEDGVIWNNYFLDIASKFCEKEQETKKKQILTGPASANKTYVAAVFGYICFLSAPEETMVLVSTTTGSASERRIWADIKDLHRNAKFTENGMAPIGEIVDYLKALTFDPAKQVYDAKLNSRDFRNGISVIPIPTDSDGEAALSQIQGSKNTFVIWILDEMAQMRPGVTRPLRNLIPSNPHVHFIGIGNANEPTDPHGENCMPKEGFKSLDYTTDREWRSANGYDVLFVSGNESPNNHPLINQGAIKKTTDYPFPYATNRMGIDLVAEDTGNGDLEKGRNTVDYWKFCIGWWAPTTAVSALYTQNLFTDSGSCKPPELVMSSPRVFGAGDFAFTSGGDDNGFVWASYGITETGKKQVTIPRDVLSLKIPAVAKEEFNKAVAKEYVEHIRQFKIQSTDFGGDSGNDAAITLNEMSKLARTHDFVPISSIGAASRPERYKNKVTELWFNARDLIRTGVFKGIDVNSQFVKQLCDRRYESRGKDVYQIEKKKDMKKRIGRSPDLADTFIYVCYMLIRSGLFDNEIEKVREVKTVEEERDEEREMKAKSFDFRDRYLTREQDGDGEDDFEFSSQDDFEYADLD
jgi:hypothetical protein